jgi:regulator of sigma E protease
VLFSLLWLLLGILGVSLLIVIHEFGHYLCARASGMRVDRFSVLGIGPVVWRIGTWKGTEFVVSAIPFGAYVHIVGMEAGDDLLPTTPPVKEDDPPPVVYDLNDPYLYRNRPVWARMLAILGGPMANYAAATVLFFGLFAAIGHRELVSMKTSAELGETAAAAGLLPGDELLRIADQEVKGKNPFAKISAATKAHKSETVPVVVQRGEQELSLQVPINEEGRLGIGLERGEVKTTPATWSEAAVFGFTEPWIKSWQNLQAMGSLFTGETKMDQMSGPIGIVKSVARAAEKGPGEYVMLMAIISSLLGLFNLLPLPALDGGRMVFMLWEAAWRRPISKRVEESIHAYGMLALFGLILYITVRNDLLGSYFK